MGLQDSQAELKIFKKVPSQAGHGLEHKKVGPFSVGLGPPLWRIEMYHVTGR